MKFHRYIALSVCPEFLGGTAHIIFFLLEVRVSSNLNSDGARFFEENLVLVQNGPK